MKHDAGRQKPGFFTARRADAGLLPFLRSLLSPGTKPAKEKAEPETTENTSVQAKMNRSPEHADAADVGFTTNWPLRRIYPRNAQTVPVQRAHTLKRQRPAPQHCGAGRCQHIQECQGGSVMLSRRSGPASSPCPRPSRRLSRNAHVHPDRRTLRLRPATGCWSRTRGRCG
jgi:hypothetical protein